MGSARSAARQALDLAELEEVRAERDRLRAEVERLTGAAPEPRVVSLPWESPPLSMNDRLGWRAEAQAVATVRKAARWVINKAKLGHHDRIEVCLHWRPARNNRRDDENPVATLKVVCDALVDEGVVDDDTARYMSKLMPRIYPAEKGRPGAVWLTVAVLA